MLALGVSVCAVIPGCTVTRVPHYEYTSSTTEVTRIYRWRIEAEPNMQFVNLAGETGSPTSPEPNGQLRAFGAKWVDSVQQNLSRDDHFQFYDNPPIDGVIHIAFYGRLSPTGTVQSVAPTDRNAKVWNSDPAIAIKHVEPTFELDADALNRIDSVNVMLFNSDNQSVGQIRMARAASYRGAWDEISAKRVAEAIKKMVNGGK
jgi:hypothetical protein